MIIEANRNGNREKLSTDRSVLDARTITEAPVQAKDRCDARP